MLQCNIGADFEDTRSVGYQLPICDLALVIRLENQVFVIRNRYVFTYIIR